jgi:kinetochore protein Mis12/MTW1
MASTNPSDTSLLTEHLKYTPLTLLDEIINSINDLSARAVDGAESGLLSADGKQLGFAERSKQEGRPLPTEKDARGKLVFPEMRLEIEEGVHKLETLLEANIDKNFDKFEIIVLRSILAVPSELVPWIRLGHYEDVPTTKESAVTPEKLQMLRQRVRETRKLRTSLQATAAKNEAIIKQLKSLVNPVKAEGQKSAGSLSFLTNGSSASQLGVAYPPAPVSDNNLGPLSTNTSFAISQLPALKELLAELKPALTSLTKTASYPASEADAARERRKFIETQSLRAMERQGLSSGTGSAEGLGRVVGMDEMMALESLVDNDQEDET